MLNRIQSTVYVLDDDRDVRDGLQVLLQIRRVENCVVGVGTGATPRVETRSPIARGDAHISAQEPAWAPSPRE